MDNDKAHDERQTLQVYSFMEDANKTSIVSETSWESVIANGYSAPFEFKCRIYQLSKILNAFNIVLASTPRLSLYIFVLALNDMVFVYYQSI